MELTEKEAIQKSIELWEWLLESGSGWKCEWDGWSKYPHIQNHCFLCQYNAEHGGGMGYICPDCPYAKKFGCCENGNETGVFDKWRRSETKRTKKKYAKLFLEQLYQLRDNDGSD